jgi:hypothetical protein
VALDRAKQRRGEEGERIETDRWGRRVSEEKKKKRGRRAWATAGREKAGC